MLGWAVGLLLAAFVLFCPIFLTIYLVTDLRRKRCWFAFYILRHVKLHGGYAAPYRSGIAFHLTDKKAVLLPYAEIVSAKGKFQITRGFRVFAYSQVFETGSAAYFGSALLLAAAVQNAAVLLRGVLRTKKKCRRFCGDALLHRDADVLQLSQRIVLGFNLFILLLAGAKLLLRKLMEERKAYGRKRQKQAGE